MDLEGKPAKKPFKPFLTQPRRRFKGNFDKGCNRQNGCFGGFNSNRRDRHGRFGNRGSFKPRRPFGKFDKSPIPNIPESQVGQSIKTKVDVSNVRNLDTSKMNVQLINPHEMKAQDQRSLKTTHILTQAWTFNPKCRLIL